MSILEAVAAGLRIGTQDVTRTVFVALCRQIVEWPVILVLTVVYWKMGWAWNPVWEALVGAFFLYCLPNILRDPASAWLVWLTGSDASSSTPYPSDRPEFPAAQELASLALPFATAIAICVSASVFVDRKFKQVTRSIRPMLAANRLRRRVHQGAAVVWAFMQADIWYQCLKLLWELRRMYMYDYLAQAWTMVNTTNRDIVGPSSWLLYPERLLSVLALPVIVFGVAGLAFLHRGQDVLAWRLSLAPRIVRPAIPRQWRGTLFLEVVVSFICLLDEFPCSVRVRAWVDAIGRTLQLWLRHWVQGLDDGCTIMLTLWSMVALLRSIPDEWLMVDYGLTVAA